MNTLTYKIALTQIKGIGNSLSKALLANVEKIEDIFQLSKKELLKIPNIGTRIVSLVAESREEAVKRAEQELEFIEKHNISALFITDKDYPFRLKECVDAPVMLYAKGNQNFNKGKFVGVVGTRKMTEYGRSLCSEFIKDLSSRNNDITIVSGLAYGVDICAHKASLDFGLNTIGVVGHGLDRIYPLQHRPTAAKMLNQGALLTEYLSGTNPDRQNFVQRNRIIAGLCDALIVIESASKGGALITAEVANSYNRDVFAFPGNVGNEFSSGCNKLIKENKAAMIEFAADLEVMMGWDTNKKNKKMPSPQLFLELNDLEQKIIDSLKPQENLHVNLLANKLELPMSRVSPVLLEMEFRGLIKCLPGNLYESMV
jgi:DNA processing protein